MKRLVSIAAMLLGFIASAVQSRPDGHGDVDGQDRVFHRALGRAACRDLPYRTVIFAATFLFPGR